VADRVAHVAHLAGAAFVQGNGDQRLVGLCPGAGFQQPDDGGGGAPAVDHDAAPHPVERGVGRLAAQSRMVFPFDLVFRMEQALGQLAVIGQQQQPFRVVVQPADGVDVLVHLGQQVEDGRPPLRVLSRRHVAARLVEEDVAVVRHLANPLAVDADVVALGIRLGPQLEHGLAVDRHAPLGDERFGRAARGHPGGREDLLKPFAGLVVGHCVLDCRKSR
jgi:hypothetical protein